MNARQRSYVFYWIFSCDATWLVPQTRTSTFCTILMIYYNKETGTQQIAQYSWALELAKNLQLLVQVLQIFGSKKSFANLNAVRIVKATRSNQIYISKASSFVTVHLFQNMLWILKINSFFIFIKRCSLDSPPTPLTSSSIDLIWII